MNESDIANLILDAEIENIVTEFNFGSKGVQKGPKRRKHIRARADLRIGTASIRLCSDTPDLTLMKRIMPLVSIPFDKFTGVHTDIRCAAAIKVEELRTIFNDSIIESPVLAEQVILSMREKKRVEEEERRRAERRAMSVRTVVAEIRQNRFTKDEVLEMWKEAVVTDVIES
jgi:hypothetical protein